MGRSGVGVLEEAADGLVGRQGHSGTHVGLAGHSWVGDPAGSGVGNAHPHASLLQHHCPGSGSRPLGCLGTLAAVFQWIAVLPLGGTEVGRSDGTGRLLKSAFHQAGGHQQPFCHGGAGPVQPQKGYIGRPQGKGGADALIEQVPAQNTSQLGRGQMGFGEGPLQGHGHHPAFGLFPGLFSKGVVIADIVKIPGQRAFPLLFAHHRGIGQHPGRVLKAIGVPCFFHISTPFMQKYNRSGRRSPRPSGRRPAPARRW